MNKQLHIKYMDILDEFGVKPILLIAQIVNFLLLLFILKRLLYKPLLKVLEERKNKIAQSLKNADEIEKKLEQTSVDREKKLREAVKDAEGILKEAVASADKIIGEARDKTSLDIEKMIKKSEEAMKLEREKMNQEIRAELANLVVSGLEKVTGKALSEKEQKELVEKSLKDLKK